MVIANYVLNCRTFKSRGFDRVISSPNRRTFCKNGHYLFFIKMIYNHIDEIIDKYGVSKDKTIFNF